MTEKIKISNTNGSLREEKRITIVGGGLVGALAALNLGRKGINVDLYEYREDIRTAELVIGRSINLSLSQRGRRALAEVGLEDELMRHGIPMRGRMLHDLHGSTTSIPYDANKKQCIFSVGRKFLNEVLLTAAEKYPNIKLHFNQKLVGANLEEGELTFLNPKTNETTNTVSDLIVGCDGAFSTVRGFLLKRSGFNFSQTYIEHAYLELCIPAKDNKFQMTENHLHIWPRGKFMMIALPNQDKTWTVTLFMPFDHFTKIKTRDELLDFFGTHFPDAIPLISEERLVKDFFKTKPQHLVSIKCKPYNLSNKVLLMGDAAHAMVPFYGQGMNAGFEDVTLFSNILEKHGHNYDEALKEFSEKRWEDAHAICDLAMYNYVEMRDLVTRRSYRLRKCVDDFLSFLMPATWVPLYNSISFTDMPYKQCVENRKWQDKMLSRLMTAAACVITGSLAVGGVRVAKTSGVPNFPGFYL